MNETIFTIGDDRINASVVYEPHNWPHYVVYYFNPATQGKLCRCILEGIAIMYANAAYEHDIVAYGATPNS